MSNQVKQKTTKEQLQQLRECFAVDNDANPEEVAKIVKMNPATVWYYKKKWGLTKSKQKRKRRSDAGKPNGKMKREILSLAALKQAYDKSDFIGKAVFISNVKSWVEDEYKKLNSK